MVSRPMSPVRSTWQPPHSSTETEPSPTPPPHLVAVLLSEESHRAELPRLLDRHHLLGHRQVAHDLDVDAALDLAQLLATPARPREVEAQPVGLDQRAACWAASPSTPRTPRAGGGCVWLRWVSARGPRRPPRRPWHPSRARPPRLDAWTISPRSLLGVGHRARPPARSGSAVATWPPTQRRTASRPARLAVLAGASRSAIRRARSARSRSRALKRS